MSLAIDQNGYPLQMREGLCPGEFLTLTGGATPVETPVAANAAKRLMPHGNAAALVSGRADQLNLGTGHPRDSLLSVVGWYLKILNAGYRQIRQITSVAGSVLTLSRKLDSVEGLGTLTANSIQWVIYPLLVLPLCIHYRKEIDNSALFIGFTDGEAYQPTPKKYAEIDVGESVKVPTQELDKVFYWFGGSAKSSGTADISWGEHYIRRS
ncbi:hypothetical protein F4Y93_06015 [Candidatus Poribacteria bacterium]|nr:hypothetical protein [Candidatus Poribacteria bacterium]